MPHVGVNCSEEGSGACGRVRGGGYLHDDDGCCASERPCEPLELEVALLGRDEVDEFCDDYAGEGADEVATHEGPGLGERGVNCTIDEDGRCTLNVSHIFVQNFGILLGMNTRFESLT